MIISIGSDHAGFGLKDNIISFLKSENIEVIDRGTYSTASVDYIDYALPVCNDVVNKVSDFGILICYTGIGMSIAANKVDGIRAALCNSVDNAFLTRSHNDANCVCLCAKDIDLDTAKQIIKTFLNTGFSEEERHIRRIKKITEYENSR